MICEYCQKAFKRKRTGPKPRFCCAKCQNKHSYRENRQARIAYAIGYQRKNRPSVQENRKRWKQSEQGKASQKKSYKRWASTEHGKILIKNHVKRYIQTVHGKIARREGVKRHNARKVINGGSHTREEFLALVDKLGSTCLCCGYRVALSKFEEDHIVPLSKGGTNSIDNIQPLCKPCNGRKGVQTVSYLPSQ